MTVQFGPESCSTCGTLYCARVFVTPGRAHQGSTHRFAEVLRLAAPAVVVGVCVAIAAAQLSGIVEFSIGDIMLSVVVIAAILVAYEITNMRQGDSLVGMSALVFFFLATRSALSWWPATFGDHTASVQAFLTVPAFLGVGIVGIAVASPFLQDPADRRPTIVLMVGAIVGWWSVLTFVVLDGPTQAELHRTAVIAVMISVATWAIGHVLLFRPYETLWRTDALIGLAGISYLVGDASGILGGDWNIAAVLRVATAGFVALAVLCHRGSTDDPRVTIDEILRPRRRELALFAVAAPMAVSAIPLLVWVRFSEQFGRSWYPPLWVGGTLVVVVGLSVAVISPMPTGWTTERALPDVDLRHLHYQPILRATDATIIGAEALFRIGESGETHSGGSIFEELMGSSKLSELTDWIVDRALYDGRRFLDRVDDPDAFVSFNMSPDEFTSPTLLERIDSALERADCTADGFMIEVTELSFLSGSNTVHERVRLLQDRGFLVALDDFGSGYASMHSLVDIDFDLVKIDRSIVVSAAQPRGEHLLRRTIDLLAGAGLLVLAEGIEDEEQAELVRRHNPHFVQGYATGRPMPIDDLLERLAPSSVTHTHQIAERI